MTSEQDNKAQQRTKGPFTPSASTSVYVRRRAFTRVDGRRCASTDVHARLRPSTRVTRLT